MRCTANVFADIGYAKQHNNAPDLKGPVYRYEYLVAKKSLPVPRVEIHYCNSRRGSLATRGLNSTGRRGAAASVPPREMPTLPSYRSPEKHHKKCGRQKTPSRCGKNEPGRGSRYNANSGSRARIDTPPQEPLPLSVCPARVLSRSLKAHK